jgi:hypothetical protein
VKLNQRCASTTRERPSAIQSLVEHLQDEGLTKKFQNLRLDPAIKLPKVTVEDKSKQNLKRKVLHVENNLDSTRAARNTRHKSPFLKRLLLESLKNENLEIIMVLLLLLS